MADEEQIMSIPLQVTKAAPRSKKAEKAVAEVQEYVAKHMKAKPEDVWMDQKVNEALWSRGMQKPPSRIRVKAVKFEDGLVEVSLPEE
ncbi:MAG: 50S ribosomal protein L31e [Methanomassiliicoccales archaeon]|jgi:large subunit ribosomal protein L31e|nr:50S ribosomal protein L31e [Methanomassiliicoccales archaeon]